MRWVTSLNKVILVLLLLSTPIFAEYIEDISLPGLQFASMSWTDMDNDGDLDMIACGHTGIHIYDIDTAETRIYTTETIGNTTTLTLTSHSLMNLTHCSVNTVDLNNDGYKDIIISGTNSTGNETLLTYLSDKGNLTLHQQLTGISFSSTTVGDIDDDGDLDLIATGCEDITAIPTPYQCTTRGSRIYINTLGTLTYSPTWSQNLTSVWYGSVAFGDYDTDGDLDLALAGYRDSTRANPFTGIYINNGSTLTYDPYNPIDGVGWGSVVWGDYDNDTDLDLFIAGENASGQAITKIYANDAALNIINSQPTPPTTFSSDYNTTLLLSWSTGTDAETIFPYYNLRAGSTPHSNSIVSGVFGGSSNPTQGYFGNMMTTQTTNLSIADQCVYWQVQSIDAGLMKSSWSAIQNYNSTEICDSYDNDCNDIYNNTNYSSTIDEGFDQDGDGFFPWSSILNNITYNCSNYDEYDCDDSSSSSYPGASCTRTGYINTHLLWNNDSHSCTCEGELEPVSAEGSPGGGGGGGGFPPAAPTCTPSWECESWSLCSTAGTQSRTCTDAVCNTTKQETQNCTYEEATEPEEQLDNRTPISLESTIIRYNELIYERNVEIVGNRTRFYESVKNMGLFTEQDVNMTVSFPKEIIATTDPLISSENYLTLQYDPIIRYTLGDIAAGQGVHRSFSVPGELTQAEADSIIVTITKYNKSEEELLEEELLLQEQINATNDVLNITLGHEIDYENNITTFNIDFTLDENVTRLGNVSIIMEIPKCMIEIIKKDDFLEDFEFEIQNPDPQIIWHVGEIITEDQLRISLKKIAEEDCLNKAKVLAVARDIQFLEHEIDRKNVLITTLITVLIFIIIVFASTYTHVIRNKNNIFQLIRRILKLHKLGWKDDKIKETFKNENIPRAEIDEAFSLNARNRLHYWFIKFGVNLGAFVIFTILISSFVDVLEILPADADFIKKIVSWVLIFIVFYHVSITRVLFGFKKHATKFYHRILNYDFAILIAYLLMLSKDIFVFAQSSVEKKAFTYDMLNLIARAQPVWEPRLFYIGLTLLIPISFVVAFRKEIYHSSLSAIIGITGRTKNLLNTLARTVMNLFLLIFFYFVIFDKMMEWLAISIDSHIVVVLFIVSMIFYIRRRLKTRQNKKKGGIEDQTVQVFGHIDDFYDHLVDLFHYRKTIILGILGILILNMLVGVSVYLIPYVIAHQDPLYSAYVGHDNHMPLFLGESIYKVSLESIPYTITYDIALSLTLALNLLAIVSVMIFISYFWYWCVKHRQNAYFSLGRFFNSRIRYIIPFALSGLTAFFMNPIFQFRPFYFLGELGVDILSKAPNPDTLYLTTIISASIFIVSWILIIYLRKITMRLFTFLSYSLMMAYITLFTYSYINYLMSEWVSAMHFILIAINGFLLYVFGGIVSFIYVLMITFKIPFLRKIFHIDMTTIHHKEEHEDIIHGYKTERISDLIIRNMARGHEPLIIVEYLIHKGYTVEEIEEAGKLAESDPRYEEAERHIVHKKHTANSIAELHKWINEQLKEEKDFDKIMKSCLSKGFYEDDIIIAIKHAKLNKRYKDLQKYDYITGVDEETTSDEDQYEEEEAFEIADYYINKGISERQIKKLLKDAKFEERTIYDILQIIRQKNELKEKKN